MKETILILTIVLTTVLSSRINRVIHYTCDGSAPEHTSQCFEYINGVKIMTCLKTPCNE
jgi:hypothetical protein